MKKLLIGASLLLLCFAGKAQTETDTVKDIEVTTGIYRMKYHYYNVTKWQLGSDTYMLSDERKGGVVTVDQRMYQGTTARRDTGGVLRINGKIYNLWGGVAGLYRIKGSNGAVLMDRWCYKITVYSNYTLKTGTKTVYSIIDPDAVTAEFVHN